MKKIILAIAIAALTLTMASQTQAAPKSSNANKNSTAKVKSSPKSTTNKIATAKPGLGTQKISQSQVKVKDYHLQHGTKFQHGFFYKGKHHNHWGVIRFDSRYGCNCYWDSCLQVWFYWCERDVCYYPVTYNPYGCYSCTEVVVVRRPVCRTCRLVTTCNACTNGQTAIVQPSTEAPPMDDLPPIPEPVSRQK